ncbi:MAG: hypothetical protein JO127_18530 [Caulobacteraceae bacterium]|nr:hypothetical protein [Caulobacteraceae bacterium]
MAPAKPSERPAAPTTEVVRTPVEGACPECGRSDLKQYPVLAFGGWFQVVKCQSCLCSVRREPWTRLGWITLPEEGFL